MKCVFPEIMLLLSISVLVYAVFLYFNPVEKVLVPLETNLRPDLYATVRIDTVNIDGMQVKQVRYLNK